jgi:molybdopterin adenylyltransferase
MLKKHRKVSPKKVNCAVLTVSDTRNEETDKSGRKMKDLLAASDHQILHYHIIPDEKDVISREIESLLEDNQIEAILVNGGTGIAKRDVTIESVSAFFDKELPGFGELFRYLSYEQDIGSASILSRAVAGVANDKVIFCTPGSTGAVGLAMEKIIMPEIGHIVMELQKDL